MTTNRRFILGCHALVLVGMSCFALSASAAEIHSNGTGGGAWSDAATWRTKTVPAAEDTVIIATGDIVSFDRDDADKQTCKDISIDPKGGLTFKAGGKRVMNLPGPLENYGAIKFDATGAADDHNELRLTGPAADRAIRLQKGGSLMLYGRPGLADGKQNVVIVSKPAAAAEAGAASPIDAPTGSTVDLQRVALDGIQVRATGIDNTGAKPNERINVSDCLFVGQANVTANGCDTPTILNNNFAYAGEAAIAVPAISVVGSPLADIRGNRINGKYYVGIMGQAQADSVISNNTIEKCTSGMYWYGANAMIKSNTIKACDTGITVTSMSGAIEDTTIDGAKLGLNVAGATLQCTSIAVTNPQKDGVLVSLSGGSMTILNCTFKPEDLKVSGAPTPNVPRATAMAYFVLKVKDSLPPGSTAEMATANPAKPLPAGAMDMNIRNNYATISRAGTTPLPATLKAMIVKTWTIENDGKLSPPPEYTVTLREPAPNVDTDGKVIKTFNVTPKPEWFRANPNDATPTMEVSIK